MRNQIYLALAACLSAGVINQAKADNVISNGSNVSGENSQQSQATGIKSYIFLLKDEVPNQQEETVAKQLATRYGGTLTDVYPTLHAFTAQFTPEAASQLSQQPEVKSFTSGITEAVVSTPPVANQSTPVAQDNHQDKKPASVATTAPATNASTDQEPSNTSGIPVNGTANPPQTASTDAAPGSNSSTTGMTETSNENQVNNTAGNSSQPLSENSSNVALSIMPTSSYPRMLQGTGWIPGSSVNGLNNSAVPGFDGDEGPSSHVTPLLPHTLPPHNRQQAHPHMPQAPPWYLVE